MCTNRTIVTNASIQLNTDIENQDTWGYAANKNKNEIKNTQV